MKRRFVLAGAATSCVLPVRAAFTPVEARRGMVASASRFASQVGANILKKGGNAIDAAVAVGLALAVTHPTAGNLGGGGFMVIRMKSGKTVAIDYRETAPAAAKKTMYLDESGKVIPRASTVGYQAAGIPGTVAGLAMALEQYGTLKWKDVVEPARRLAEQGFPLSFEFVRDLQNGSKLLEKFPESNRIYLRNGRYYEAGEVFRQPELAETFKRLQEKGPREFYEGKTAQLIAEDMKANGGLITLADLKSYQPKVREVLRGTYRGYEILTMPPPSSGGGVLLEMLNMLEGYDLASMGANSSVKYHVVAEVMRRAFADRAELFGDPDFVTVPIKGLVTKAYAKSQRAMIDLAKATPSSEVKAGKPQGYESEQTTHFSAVDSEGNVVSNTYTLNLGYGSGVTVKGAGFLLNNEMDDFTTAPNSPNAFNLIQGEANAIAPNKRPLSSMTPTIVLKDGQFYMTVGSPGGPTIINTVLQIILNVLDHGMNIQQAVDAPRIHHQWLPDRIVYEPYGLSPDVITNLQAKGHTLLKRNFYIGDAQVVMRDPKTGLFAGASDSRNPDGLAVGY